MIIDDPIYGRFEVNEEILKRLIKSPALQRLKKIQQFGPPPEYCPFPQTDRFQHSLGVALLLRRLGASLEEQVAGLLHDVSHTAFSHVSDWILGGDPTKEDLQDLRHKTFIYNSPLIKILEKFGFDPRRITDHENYTLLEKEAPDLCADRIDYTLKEFHLWSNPKIVKPIVENLKVVVGEIVFTNKKWAKKFGKEYAKLQRVNWASPKATVLWYVLAELLKKAIEEKVINQEDFYQDDEFIMNKIRASENNRIKHIINILEDGYKFELVEKDPQFFIKKKFRFVDPKFLSKGKVYKLSDEDKDYKGFLKAQRSIYDKGVGFSPKFQINI